MTETFVDSKDLDLTVIVDAFNPATETGRDALTERLSKPLTDLAALQDRQAQLQAIKTKIDRPKAQKALQTLKDTEADVVSVGTASEDERLKDYYTQILWDRKSVAARLNHLGWLNEIIVFFRTIFVPGLSILLPLMILLGPLLVFTVVLKKPITFSQYIGMIQGAIKNAVPSVLGAPRFAGKGDLVEKAEQFVHIGLAIAMLGASIWNQVSAAIHMRSIVADMRRRAESVQRFTEATRDLSEALGVPVDLGAPWSFGALGAFGDAWNDPGRIDTLLKAAGHLDMLASLALKKKVCRPSLSVDVSGLDLTDLYYPGLKAARMNSISLDGSGCHCLLTGPNRGGKSTLLKSVGYAVLMGQTVGIVFARKARQPIYDSIITALSPSDVVGKLSLFEAEIEFAKTVLERLDKGRTFLMMDEIFHGTNAHDGVEAAQVFLDRIYKAPALTSIVSTHYMDLPEKYGASGIQTLCMEASVDPTDADRLIYTYRLMSGINKFSSVREILRERGLLRPNLRKNIGDPK
jgi:hypothetical protein